MRYATVCFFAFLFLVGALQAEEHWQSFGPSDEPGAPRIELLWANLTGASFEVDIPGMWVMDVEEDGETYQRLRLLSGGRTADLGYPEMPYLGRFVAVPKGADVSVTVTPLDSLDLLGYQVWPAQEQPIDGDEGFSAFHVNAQVYGGESGFPEQSVLVSGKQIVRGLETVLVGVFPLRFHGSHSKISVYNKLRVDIQFSGGYGYFVDQRLRSRFFEPVYGGMLVNYAAMEGYDPLPTTREDGAEMIIIVPDALYEALEPLATWRTMSGLPTMVVTRTDAGSDAEGIRAYIQQAYDQWEVPPSFVLMIGDSDLLPTNYLYTHPYDGNLTGTDLWYFTVDGDDQFADIHHGRISVENAQDLDILNKIIDYEKDPPPGDWNNHVFLAAYEEAGRYFTIVSDMIYDYLTSIGYDCDRAYEAGNPPGNTQDVIDNFNVGSFIVNHRDHGDTDGWSHPSFTISHLPQLANGDLLPVVYSLNCLSGYFDAETDEEPGTFECFCEEILRLNPGGAVGVLGATRVSYSGYNDEFVKGIYDAMWPGFDPGYPGGTSENPWGSPTFRQGIVLNFAKWWMWDKYVLTNGAGYPWTPDATTTRAEMEMLHYYGDPSMDVHSAEPSVMVVSHDPATVVGIPSFDVFADVEGALASISRDGTLLGRAFVSGGVATIVFDEPPTIPGTIDVVVTAHNYIPYLGQVEIAPASGSYVVIDSVMVDDYWGYSDGVVDQGDSLGLSLRLWNVGSELAPTVTGQLSSTDPAVTIVNDFQTYGDIPADGTASSAGQYLAAVAGGTEDGHILPFALAVAAGDSLWTRQFALAVHAPVLAYADFMIDDSSGNNDGKADPGETVDLFVRLANNGSGTASQVTADLDCADENITIGTSNAVYPNISPEDSVVNVTAFVLSVDGECPEGLIIPFELDIVAFGPYQTQDEFQLVVGHPTVLLVDTDNETHEARLVEAMDLSGYSYDFWYVPDQGSIPADILEPYKAVVWTAGDQNVSSISEIDRQNVTTYLNHGGALLFSAENYLTSYGSDSFTSDYLHVADYTTSITVDGVDGVPGDPITDGMSMATDFPGGLSTYPDAIVPDAEAAGIFTVQGSGEITALRYPAVGAATYRVIFMATPFEALEPGQPAPNNPETFLINALGWLIGAEDSTAPTQIEDLSIDLSPSEQDIVLSWSPAWDNIGVDHYTVYRSTEAYFSPGPGFVVGTTASTTWTDTGAAGDPAVAYFYVVTAVDGADNESLWSNRVGEEDYLTPTGETAAGGAESSR